LYRRLGGLQSRSGHRGSKLAIEILIPTEILWNIDRSFIFNFASIKNIPRQAKGYGGLL
jgi:hypothetical protein